MKPQNSLLKILKTSQQKYLYNSLLNSLTLVTTDLTPKQANSHKDLSFVIKYPYSYEELTNIINTQMSSITLALTEQCNLRCQYCAYMSKYLKQKNKLTDMNEHIAFKAIDILMAHSTNSKDIFIDFYGGEPLLKFNLIKKCINYCKEKYSFHLPNFQITTNGLLLNDEIINFLIKNNFYVNLSLDGPSYIHDKYRIDINGLPSFKKVYKNIVNFYKQNPYFFSKHVIFNSVITPDSGSTEQFEFLENLRKSDVFLIEAKLTEYFLDLINNKENLILNYSNEIKKHSIFKKSSLKNMQKYHVALNCPSFQQDIFHGGFCIPGTRKNFITYDGKIIVCEKVNENENTFQVGDVFSGIDINKVKKLIDVTIEKTQKCKTCWAAKFCNICFKDIFNLTDSFCENSRKRIEKELIYYLENIKSNKNLTNYLENLSVE